jgi:hypothetical protein
MDGYELRSHLVKTLSRGVTSEIISLEVGEHPHSGIQNLPRHQLFVKKSSIIWLLINLSKKIKFERNAELAIFQAD